MAIFDAALISDMAKFLKNKFGRHVGFSGNAGLAAILDSDLVGWSCKGSRTLRKSAKVMAMSLKAPPPRVS